MTVTEQEKRATETLSKAFQSVSAPKREYLLGFLEGFAAKAPITIPASPDTGQTEARPKV